MNPYREPDYVHRRESAIREGRRIRDALDNSPRIGNIAGKIGSSQEIIDALTDLLELVE